MNHHAELLVQAYVDGELGFWKRRKAEALVRTDPEARQLCDALRATKELLSGNEMELRLPVSREFYWAGIERRLQTESAPVPEPSSAPFAWPGRWIRLTASLAMAAVAVGLILSSATKDRATRFAEHLREVETPSEEVSGVSFHSYSEDMTLVWVQIAAK